MYITEKYICQGLCACLMFDENSFIDTACTLKLGVVNPINKETTWVVKLLRS